MLHVYYLSFLEEKIRIFIIGNIHKGSGQVSINFWKGWSSISMEIASDINNLILIIENRN